MRRAGGALLAILAVSAAAQTPMQQMPPDTSFMAATANEIHAVVGFTPPEFTLSPRNDAQFAFYGREVNRLDGVRCERHASFEFVALGNLTGSIQAGVCRSEAKRVRTLAVLAPRGLESVLAQLNLSTEMRAKAGWTATRRNAGNGSEQHAFPVMAIGHGVLVVDTVVLVPHGMRDAVIVQADTIKLCEDYGLRDKTVLCRDTRQALLQIAQRVEARFTQGR